jgi:lysophospholipase L1-like esterase
MHREIWKALALVAISVALTLFVAELVARHFYPVPPRWLDPQVTHLESPLLGWVLPPGFEAYTIDAPVRVNSLGLRDDELATEKPEGERRILALGDSFTFALGVRFEDLWVQQLERTLNRRSRTERFQVINAGVAGYNTRQELIALETSGWNLEPDLVVVAFYWNDLIGNEAPLPDYQNTPRLSSEPMTWERGERDDTHLLPAFIRDRLRQSVLLYQVVIRAKQLYYSLQPGNHSVGIVQRSLLAGDWTTLEPYWAATASRLREIAAAASRRGTPVILVLFPMENEIRSDYPEMRLAERLHSVWAPTGMPFVDLGPAFRASLAEGENPFLPYDLHPNAAGMRIASEHLLAVIERQGSFSAAFP